VWDLERYLTQRRKDLDRRFEFRFSRLTQVFGMLLSERRILDEQPTGVATTPGLPECVTRRRRERHKESGFSTSLPRFGSYPREYLDCLDLREEA
jgi:hypothetical protein